MTSETTFCNLSDFSCKCVWNQDHTVDITLLSSRRALSGSISQQQLITAGGKLNIESVDDVIKQAKLIFTNAALDKHSLVVEAANEDHECDKLIWKKLIGKTKKKILEVELRESDDVDSVQKSFIRDLVSDNQTLRREKQDLQRRHDNMKITMQNSLTTLETLEKEKTNLENKLYAQFLPILNAKKEEIVRLRNHDNEDEEELNDDHDDQDNYDVDTDVEDDNNSIEPEPKKMKTNQ